MTSRVRKILRWLVIANMVFTLVSLLALAWVSQTVTGRAAAARFIEAVVDEEIPGTMTIGRIEQLGTPTIVRDLQIRDPRGASVLEVDHAAIEFDLMGALDGLLAFHSAKVTGGRVFLAIDPSGRTTLEEALSAPAPEPDPAPHGGLHFAMRDIELEGVHLMFKASAGESYRVRGIRGRLAIHRESTVGARVLLTEISGDLQEKVAGLPVRLVSVTGWVHGAEKQVLDLRALTRVGESGLNAHIEYFDRDEKPVEVMLSRSNGLEAEIQAVLVYLQSMTTSDLEVRLEDS